MCPAHRAQAHRVMRISQFIASQCPNTRAHSFGDKIEVPHLILAIHRWLRNLRFHAGVYQYWHKKPGKDTIDGIPHESDPNPAPSREDMLAEEIVHLLPNSPSKIRVLLKCKTAFKAGNLASDIKGQLKRLVDAGLVEATEEHTAPPVKRQKKDGQQVKDATVKRTDWKSTTQVYRLVPLDKHSEGAEALRKALQIAVSAFPHSL